MNRRRRAAVLALVLLCLALAAALIMPLALLSGTEALTVAQRAAALRHQLAAESVIALLPELLAKDDRIVADLDRLNRAEVDFEMEGLRVTVLIQDDGAKLALPIMAEATDRERIPSALRALQSALPRLALTPTQTRRPSLTTQSVSSWTRCLEDLFDDPTDAALYGAPRGGPAWTQFLTPVGNAINVNRADAAVLEAALGDLEPGLGRRLTQQRRADPAAGLAQWLAALELPERVRGEATRRLTEQSDRYSLLIRIDIAGDVRQRYVICALAQPPQVLVDWEVAP